MTTTSKDLTSVGTLIKSSPHPVDAFETVISSPSSLPIDGLSTTIHASDPLVGTLGSRVNSTHPADLSTVKATLTARKPQIKANLRSVAPSLKDRNITVWKESRGNVREAHWMKQEDRKNIKEAYADAVTLMTEMPGFQKAEKITFDLTYKQVCYMENGVQKIADLAALEALSKDFNLAIIHMQEVAEEIYPSIRPGYYKPTHNSKGNLHGATPCVRNNAVLAQLPTDFKSSTEKALSLFPAPTDQAKQKMQAQRLAKLEGFHSRMGKFLGDKVASAPAKTPSPWKKAHESWKEIDLFALSAATQALGDSDRAEVISPKANNVVNKLNEMLSEEHKKKHSSWISKVPILSRFASTPKEAATDYPVDVAGLMFNALDPISAREPFAQFCQSHDVMVKNDGLEDFMMRALLHLDDPQVSKFFETWISQQDVAIQSELRAQINTMSQQLHTEAQALSLQGNSFKEIWEGARKDLKIVPPSTSNTQIT